MPMIVLTRPEAAARHLARALRARGMEHAIIFSPIMVIVPLPVGDTEGAVPVFTSVNGVQAARAAITGRDVVVVGDRTAAAARAAGARPQTLGGTASSLGDALVARGGGPYLHLHGRHVTDDLAERLRGAGLQATSRVVYEQRETSLTDAARAALLGDAVTVLPLFSSRTASLVARDLGNAPRNTIVVAISNGVARCWPWSTEALVAQKPDMAAMLDCMAKVVVSDRAD